MNKNLEIRIAKLTKRIEKATRNGFLLHEEYSDQIEEDRLEIEHRYNELRELGCDFINSRIKANREFINRAITAFVKQETEIARETLQERRRKSLAVIMQTETKTETETETEVAKIPD
ncbi:MAG: hypothetical protein WC375_09165 [Methanomassiliicoccales archaeon]|jgi:hypothetical protein